MITKKPMTQTIPSTIYFDKRMSDFEASSDNFTSLLSNSKMAAQASLRKQPSTNRINYKLDSKAINYFGYNLNPNGHQPLNGTRNGGGMHGKLAKKQQLSVLAGKSGGNLNLLANNSTASFTSLLAGSGGLRKKSTSGKSNNISHLASQSQFFKPENSLSSFEQESFIIAKHQKPPPTKTFQKYAIERQINHFMSNKEAAAAAAAANNNAFRPKSSSSKSNSKFMVSKMLSGELDNETTKSVANLLGSSSHANLNSTSTISIGSSAESKLGQNNAQNAQQQEKTNSKTRKNVS
jgi:hypothetical protein